MIKHTSHPLEINAFNECARLSADGPTNEDIKRTIANMYAEFVSNINVDGSVLDYLYQEGVITLHRKDKVWKAITH